MTVYFNLKSAAGLETIDEFSQQTGQTTKDFRKYVRAMLTEYHICGMHVYSSSRACKNWK